MAVEQVLTQGNHSSFQDESIDASGTNSSGTIDVDSHLQASFQVVWSGMTGTATYELQSSEDGTNFDQVAGTSATTSGAAGSASDTVATMPGRKTRLTITSAATAGTLKFYYTGKRGSSK